MIVDTSAVVAIVFGEPEAERFSQAITDAPSRYISVVNWLEAMMVAESRMGAAGRQDMVQTLADLNVEPIAFGPEQMRAAHSAWQRYGKGRHAAGLNLGDCCAYAAAVTRNEPLLFKGANFVLTDAEPAIG